MRHNSVRTIVMASAFGALLTGCATTMEMGPGYYHYDSRAAYRAPMVVQGSIVEYQEPVVVYREPVAIYPGSAVARREPTVVYRSTVAPSFYNDHGQ